MSMSEKTFIHIYDPPPPGLLGREIVVRGDVKIPEPFCGFTPYITGV